MVSKTVTLINPSGLHARPASEFVRAAKQFASAVKIRRAGEEASVNAKSMVMVLALGLCVDTEVEIIADGADEQTAVDTLAALIESGFGEV